MDEILQDLRTYRDELAARCDYDVRKLFAHINEESRRRGDKLAAPRPPRPPQPVHPLESPEAVLPQARQPLGPLPEAG